MSDYYVIQMSIYDKHLPLVRILHRFAKSELIVDTVVLREAVQLG